MADWVPTYLYREEDLGLTKSSLIVGASTVVGGVAGTLFGSFAGDRLVLRGVKNAYFLVSGSTMGVSTVAIFVLLLLRNSLALSVVFLVIGQLFLFGWSGLTNAILANAVSPLIRTRAFSVQILLVHALGDAISPPIVGAISDATGSLRTACLLFPVAQAVAAAFFLYGWFFLDPLPIDRLIPLDDASSPPPAASAVAASSGAAAATESTTLRTNSDSLALTNESESIGVSGAAVDNSAIDLDAIRIR